MTSYSFSDLDPSKTYYYSVVGYNKTGPSSMSAAAGATPIPKAPASITATLGAGSNTITWPSTNGATGGYTLYYSTSTPVTTSDNAFAVSGTSYTKRRLVGVQHFLDGATFEEEASAEPTAAASTATATSASGASWYNLG